MEIRSRKLKRRRNNQSIGIQLLGSPISRFRIKDGMITDVSQSTASNTATVAQDPTEEATGSDSKSIYDPSDSDSHNYSNNHSYRHSYSHSSTRSYLRGGRLWFQIDRWSNHFRAPRCSRSRWRWKTPGWTKEKKIKTKLCRDEKHQVELKTREQYHV